MHVPTTVAGMILAQIVFFVWGLIDQSFYLSRAARYESSSFQGREFRMSWRAYAFPILMLGICSWLWFGANTTHAPNLMRVLALAFGLLSVFVIYSNYRIRFVIRNGKFSYIEGQQTRWSFALAEIRDVRVIASSRCGARIAIFIADKEKYYPLDLGFQQVPLLIAMLRGYRPKIDKQQRLQILIEQLTQLVGILRLDPKCQWLAHFESCLEKAQQLQKTDFSQDALDKFSTTLTSVYGGMGSFSDYGPVISDSKTGKTKMIATTEEFDRITKCVFAEATALRES